MKQENGTMTQDMINFGLRLLLICAVAAAGLSITYGATKENIAKMEVEEREEGARNVLEPAGLTPVEDADLLAEVQGASENLGENTIAVFKGVDESGNAGGYAFVLKAKGYNFMTMAVGVDLDGKVIAVDVVKHDETPGIGSKPADDAEYLSNFEGMGPGELKLKVDVDAYTGATFTSKGIVSGVNMALEAFRAVNEGN